MTNRQIKFLIAIYKSGKTAEELCKELKIKPYDNDKFGGCYNALNTDINYLTSDDGNEIDSMFELYIAKNPFRIMIPILLRLMEENTLRII